MLKTSYGPITALSHRLFFGPSAVAKGQFCSPSFKVFLPIPPPPPHIRHSCEKQINQGRDGKSQASSQNEIHSWRIGFIPLWLWSLDLKRLGMLGLLDAPVIYVLDAKKIHSQISCFPLRSACSCHTSWLLLLDSQAISSWYPKHTLHLSPHYLNHCCHFRTANTTAMCTQFLKKVGPQWEGR